MMYFHEHLYDQNLTAFGVPVEPLVNTTLSESNGEL